MKFEQIVDQTIKADEEISQIFLLNFSEENITPKIRINCL